MPAARVTSTKTEAGTTLGVAAPRSDSAAPVETRASATKEVSAVHSGLISPC